MTEFQIQNMTCGHCASVVTKTVQAVESESNAGLRPARASRPDRIVRAPREQLVERLRRGYPPPDARGLQRTLRNTCALPSRRTSMASVGIAPSRRLSPCPGDPPACRARTAPARPCRQQSAHVLRGHVAFEHVPRHLRGVAEVPELLGHAEPHARRRVARIVRADVAQPARMCAIQSLQGAPPAGCVSRDSDPRAETAVAASAMPHHPTPANADAPMHASARRRERACDGNPTSTCTTARVESSRARRHLVLRWCAPDRIGSVRLALVHFDLITTHPSCRAPSRARPAIVAALQQPTHPGRRAWHTARMGARVAGGCASLRESTHDTHPLRNNATTTPPEEHPC